LRTMLALPHGGSAKLRIGGTGANRYFAGLSRALGRPARDARFAITSSGRVGIVPARAGRVVNVADTAATVLAAAMRRDNRVADVVIAFQRPRRTTQQARSLGIRGLVGTYETIYG